MGFVTGEGGTIRDAFIDPREHPDPPCRVSTPSPASGPEELAELLDFCRAGRIYAAEVWIRAGKPIWFQQRPKRPGRPPENPLAVAIEYGQYDLTVLLLANGYPVGTVEDSFLERLLDRRLFPYFDLLLAWGGDILRVSPETVLYTYNVSLYERYEAAGGDLSRHHALALMLGDHSSNRPGYGWAKRRSAEPRVARELAIALGIAVRKGSERTIALLLWAGADPHLPAPCIYPEFYRPGGEEDENEDDPDYLTTAISSAVSSGHAAVLSRLKIDPARDDIESLWHSVSDTETLEALARIQLPRDWSQTLVWNLHRSLEDYGSPWKARACLERMVDGYSARLTVLGEESVERLRRAILKAKDASAVRWVLRTFRRPECCEPAIFDALTRTSTMRARCTALHVSTTAPHPKAKARASNPGAARNLGGDDAS